MVLVDVDIDGTGQDGIVYRYISKGPVTTNTNFSAIYGSYDLYFNETIRRIQFPNTVTPTDYESSTQTSRPYFMFSGVTIPQGSTIVDATLTFSINTSSANFGATWTGKVYGRKTATPQVYGTPATGTGVFTKTNATAFGTFTVSGAPTSTTRTQKQSDITATVQELVNTFDYNNDIMMFTLVGPTLPALPPTTVTPTATTQVTASLEAEEDPATNTANLTINYTESSPTSNGFMLDPQTEKVTFGVVSDGTHSGIARDIAQEFGVSESFKDDFSTDNWTNVAGTQVVVNTGTEVIDWASSLNSVTNEGIVIDLTGANVDSSKWLLRFKLDIKTLIEGLDGSANDLFVGLSDDNTSVPNVSQNYLGWRITAQNDISTSKWAITDSLNQIMYSGADNLIPITEPVVGVFYVEYKRTSPTTVEATIYTDAKFSVVLNTISITVQNVTNLRFLKVMVGNFDGTGDSTFDGTIDNMQFWDGVTEPVITDNDWRLRFELDITNLDDGANATDKRLYMLMTDEDETSDSNNPQDSLGLLLRTDNAITNFSIIDTNGTSPINASADATFATAPSVSTFFVEIIRSSDSVYEASLYPDNTFTTPTETEVGSVMVNTVGLKYLKFMNESTLTGAGAIDGTIDNITFTNLATAGVTKEFEFEVNALIKRTGDVLCAGTGPPVVSFTEDFTTNAGWTYTGSFPSKLLVDDASFPDVLRLECFRSTGVDGSQHIEKSMGVTINENNSQTGDIVWEFDHNHIAPCFGFASTNSMFSLTEDALHIGDNRTTKPHLTYQATAVTVGSPGIQGQTASYGDGINPVVTTAEIPLVNNTQYFPRITKFKNGTLQLEIFTDSGRTNHTAGSPVSIDASSIQAKELKNIQLSSVSNGGNGRRQRADFDNVLLVENDGCPTVSVDALLKELGVNACASQQQQVVYSQNSGFDTNWITQGDGSISPVFGGATVGFSANTDGDNDGTARDLLDVSALGQLVSDTEFELVYSVNFIGLTNGSVPFLNGNAVMIGLSSQNQTVSFQTGGSDDALFVRVLNQQFPSSGPTQMPRWQLYYKDGSGLVFLASSLDNPNDNPILGTQWVKMERLSATTARLRVATDSGFTNIRYDSGVVTIPSTIGGLRYMKSTDTGIFNTQPAQIVGSFDNITLTTVTGNDCLQVDALIQSQGDGGVCSVETYMDDMSSATGWVSTDVVSPGFFDVTGGVLDFDTVADNSNDTIGIDLSDPSRLGVDLPDSGGWRMRCTLKWDSFNLGVCNHMFIGLSNFENVNYGAGVEDAIMIRFQGDNAQNPTAPRWIPDFKNSLPAPDLTEPVGRVTDLFTAGVTYGVEIKRDSATQATCTLYTDNTFTTILQQDTYTIPSTITGLKYFKVGNWKFSNFGGMRLRGEIDDLVVETGVIATGNVGCAQVDARLVIPQEEEFEVNALIIALGDNGVCPIPATVNIYSTPNSLSLAERQGGGTNRAGEQVIDATHVGEAIEDVEWFLRRNGTGATGSLFATVRNSSDDIISTSTNSVLAQSLPTGGAGVGITFTFPERIVLQQGDRILLEFPNCIGCGANSPNVFMFGVAGPPPAGWSRTFFSLVNFAYNKPEDNQDFHQSGNISKTTSSAIPGEQRACASVNAIIQESPQSPFEFEIDGIPFIPPAVLINVDAIIDANNQEKEFFVDGCLRSPFAIDFDLDACIQRQKNIGEFTVDGHVFILPVRNVLVDAIVRYAQGANPLGAVPDLIIRVLRENSVLTGRQIVDEVVIITSDPSEGISFRGKNSRIKNWISRLERDQLIQQDNSDPDWHETNWSLGPLGLPLP